MNRKIDSFLRQQGYHSPELAAWLSTKWKIENVRADTILIKSDKICDKVWFLNLGVIHWYQITNTGRKFTTWFSRPNEFIYLPDCIYNQLPSKHTIEALETCELCFISKADFLQMRSEFPETDMMIRNVWFSWKTLVEEHETVLRTLNSADRYAYLQSSFADIVDTAHKPYLASFLNIDVSSFYKIRKQFIQRRH